MIERRACCLHFMDSLATNEIERFRVEDQKKEQI